MNKKIFIENYMERKKEHFLWFDAKLTHIELKFWASEQVKKNIYFLIFFFHSETFQFVKHLLIHFNEHC